MNKTWNALVVDDEAQSRSLVKTMLEQQFPGIFLMREAADVDSALQMIQEGKTDLLLLDVQMQGETGFDLLNRLPSWPGAIIFITAHSDFAVRAFRYSALDYLLKPIDGKEFREAVNKAAIRLNDRQSNLAGQLEHLLHQLKNGNQVPEKLMVPSAEGILFIHKPEILYCRAISNYTEFVLTDNKKIISSQTLGHYSDLLGPPAFFRIHRSFLVNISHIRMYKRGDGGTVIMNDGQEIEVSRNNKESFLQLFKSR